MHRLIIFCLCLSVVWAIPTSSRIIPFKTPRIINGERAELGQFPWQAAISVTAEGIWFCGAAIISEEWLLTAAHCVNGAKSALINTGLIDLNSQNAKLSESKEFIRHEGYNATTLENDIGLIKLTEPLVFDANTAAIELADEYLEDHSIVRVSGWGITSDAGAVSQYLNYVDVETITTEECEPYYGGPGQVFEGIVCAQSEYDSGKKSPCSGDSGGPAIVFDEDDRVIQVALVSFVSNQGCEIGYPSGFTRTAFYREWIRENTGV